MAGPSELLTNTVDMPAARARATIALMSPPSALWSSQIHMPLPLKTSGSVPGVVGGVGVIFGGAVTVILIAFERRPALSETVTLTVPARVPGGTRAT